MLGAHERACHANTGQHINDANLRLRPTPEGCPIQGGKGTSDTPDSLTIQRMETMTRQVLIPAGKNYLFGGK
jgi:hypothetical protein